MQFTGTRTNSSKQSDFKSKIVVVLALMAIVLLAMPAVADEKLPSGEDVLKQFLKATGGEEALKKVTNRITHGSMEIVGMGLTGTMVSYNARPALHYVAIESPAIGKMESGSNGDVFWEMSMMTGPRIKEGAERDLAIREGNFDGLLNWRDYYTNANTDSIVTLDGVECYRVIMTPKSGQPETMYFAKESHLLVKNEMQMETPMGVIPMESYISDYRKVDNLMMAFKVRQVVMGTQEMLLTTDKVELNGEIPEGLFDLPTEIQGLVKKEQSTGK